MCSGLGAIKGFLLFKKLDCSWAPGWLVWAVIVQSLVPPSACALTVLSLISGPIVLILLQHAASWLVFVFVFLFLFSGHFLRSAPTTCLDFSAGHSHFSSHFSLFCVPQALALLLMAGYVFEGKKKKRTKKKKKSWIGSRKARIKRANVALHYLALILQAF